MISHLGWLRTDEHPNHSQAVLDRDCRPGRSIGVLALGLRDFLTDRNFALASDHVHQLGAGRRQRRLEAIPNPLGPGAEAFSASWGVPVFA